MQTVYVRPSDGGRVRQPERASRVMPAEGALVPRNSYYERLIIGKDVVICDPPKATQVAEAPVAEAVVVERAVPHPVMPAPRMRD
jgi:hypothetical protein